MFYFAAPYFLAFFVDLYSFTTRIACKIPGTINKQHKKKFNKLWIGFPHKRTATGGNKIASRYIFNTPF